MKLPKRAASVYKVGLLVELVFLAGLFFSVSEPVRAGANIITVNSPLDSADASAGTGTCNTGALVGGQPECTLRAAIQTANVLPNVGGAADEINIVIVAANFPSQCTGSPTVCTLSPATFFPAITQRTKINGYTQSGASENTNATNQASNAAIRIHVSGTGLPAATTLFTLDASAAGSTIQGLRIESMAGPLARAISIEGNNNIVRGTELALISGSALLINGSSNTIGGSNAGDRNVIWGAGPAGDDINGISIAGANDPASNVIQGSFIGIQPNGTAGGLRTYGIQVQASPNNTIGGTIAGARNVISNQSAFGSAGIAISGFGNINDPASTGNIIQGNYIGTNLAGTGDFGNFHGIVLSASSNTVGGTTGLTPGGPCTGACNLISGNDGTADNGAAISIENAGANIPTDNVIRGNFIGTNAAGTAALPNFAGIATTGVDDTEIIANLISGNEGPAILLGFGTAATDSVVQGNRIGVAADGATPMGNGVGIWIQQGSGNLLGGTSPSAGNTIAYSNAIAVPPDGVWVTGAAQGNPILGNSIFGNNGIGTDLWPGSTPPSDGSSNNDVGTPHDADGGGNNRQNFPELHSASADGSQTTIVSTLRSLANTNFRIEFFDNAACDTSGRGEGGAFLGFKNVLTNANGDAANFAHSVANLAAGRVITSTATRLDGLLSPIETSEFSSCQAVVSIVPVDTDGDGYTDAAEQAIFENPNLYCAIMRADVDHNGSVAIGDLAAVAGVFLQQVPPNGSAPARYDQGQTPDGVLNISDLAAMAGQFLKPVGDCPPTP